MHDREQSKNNVFWWCLLGVIVVNLALHSGFGALDLPLDPLRWVFLFGAAIIGGGTFLFTQERLVAIEGAFWSVGFFVVLSGITITIGTLPLLSALKWLALALQVATLGYVSAHLLSISQWGDLFVYAFACTSLVVVLACAVYMIGYNPFWPHPLWNQGRLAAVSNPNSVAGVAALNGIMGLWMRTHFPKGWGRNIVYVLLGISLFVLYMTGSRTSGGSFLVGVLIWAWATDNMRWFYLLLTAAFFALLASEGFFYEVTEPFRLRNPVESRENVWQASYHSWLEQPWFGYGYGITGQEYTIQSLASAVGSVRDAAGYLGLLESVGLVGASALFTMYGVMLSYVWKLGRLWRRGTRSKELWVALVGGTVFTTLVVHAGGEAWIIAPGGFPHILLWVSVGAILAGRSQFFTTNRQNTARATGG
ncbi:O-antigen ligase [Salinibacter ruber]|uniref:O-antigen ligase family protein n=1 Tax=Salinibacter ruber TaxID=146919 RepID=UPI002167455E|nr:O-antigen ligase family protein [Salinibacter ruber]MCS4191746.1 O-antigen ligase [Salinibacter ruber]